MRTPTSPKTNRLTLSRSRKWRDRSSWDSRSFWINTKATLLSSNKSLNQILGSIRISKNSKSWCASHSLSEKASPSRSSKNWVLSSRKNPTKTRAWSGTRTTTPNINWINFRGEEGKTKVAKWKLSLWTLKPRWKLEQILVCTRWITAWRQIQIPTSRESLL